MTTMLKKEAVQRKWYVLDAAGKPMGRVAATAAKLLRGKHKVDFTPNVDCGDFVIIVNADKAVLTGKKLDQKHYYHHTGWIGNLKDVKYRTLMEQRPEFAMELAVKGMLPKNTLGRAALTRCKIYKGAEHKNAAQKPEAWTLDQSGGKRLCTRARDSISTAPAVANPPSPAFACIRAAPAPSPSTVVTSTITSASTR